MTWNCDQSLALKKDFVGVQISHMIKSEEGREASKRGENKALFAELVSNLLVAVPEQESDPLAMDASLYGTRDVFHVW